MTIDKSIAFLIFSIAAALVAFVFFLKSFFSWHSDEVILNGKESGIGTIAVPTTDATVFSSSLYPTLSAPETDKRENNDIDDIAEQSSHLEDDHTNKPLERLTEGEIWILIEALEKKKTELHEAMEYKRKLSNLAQDRMFDLDDDFQAKFDENLKERQGLVEDFEQNVLNGASLDTTSRTATPEEIEELANRPRARSLLDTVFQEKSIGKQWATQSQALADEARTLANEYGKIYEEILDVESSIAELKAMLP